jgi:hypothetical protein
MPESAPTRERIVAAVGRADLGRFLPDDEVRPAAEWIARIVLTYGFNPSPAVDPHDVRSVRRMVRTYLLPALSSRPPDSPAEERP